MSALLLVAVGIGCGDEHAEETVPAGVDPAALEFRPAEVVGSPPCDREGAGALMVEDLRGGTCLELGEAVVDASMVDSAEITDGLHGPVVTIELDLTGAEALDELAATHLGGDSAVLSNGELLSVVSINAPDLPNVIELDDLGAERARALVGELGGDGDETIASDPQMELQRVAERICEAYRPPVGSELEVVGFGPTTMEEQNDLLHKMGQSTIDPLPGTSADTTIALCSYRLPVDVAPSTPPPTTICPDGATLDLTAPLQYLVAENGSAIEDPQDYSLLGDPVCG